MNESCTDTFTPSEAAAMLGVTPNRIRQLMRAGELDFEWTPLGRLVRRASLERLRERREQARRARTSYGG